MKEKIESLIREALQAVDACGSIADLNKVKVKYLGKSGELTALLRGRAL